MNVKHIIFTVTFCLLMPYNLLAQKDLASVRGFVVNEETGEAVIMANVYLEGTYLGQLTNVDGYFAITRIQPGDYNLIVQSLGFEKESIPVHLISGELASFRILLKYARLNIDEAVISAEMQERKRKVQLSQIKLTAKEIGRIPSLGASPDLAEYLQILPGVLSSGDQGGQIYVRGGSPVQNLVLIDGIPVCNPFHSFGSFSVIETDLVSAANISTGAYPADYGGRISSVMDITLRDGHQNNMSGKISLSSFVSSVMLEGPIPISKKRKPLSFIISAKGSSLSRTGSLLNPWISKDRLPFEFGDLLGKVNFEGKNGSRVSCTVFNFTDQVRPANDQRFYWNNRGVGANAVLLTSASSGLIHASVNYSDYHIVQENTELGGRSSRLEDYRLNLEFVNYYGHHETKIGTQISGINTSFNSDPYYNINLSEENHVTDLALYLTSRFRWSRLIIEPGIRLNYYSSHFKLIPEPRIGVKYQLLEDFRIKFGGGYYSQNLVSGKSDRDIVNFFTGFLMDPRQIANEATNKILINRLQSSWQIVSGFECDPFQGMHVNAELFYKYYPQLITINVHKKYIVPSQDQHLPAIYCSNLLIETGSAFGFEVSGSYDLNNLYLWLAYSMAYSNHFDGLLYYHPHYDRRHNLNILAAWNFGRSQNQRLQIRWNYGSGFPFTPSNAMFEKLTLSGFSEDEVMKENGILGISYGEYNSERLPDFHRLDFSYIYSHKFASGRIIEGMCSVINIYNRNNLFFFDRLNYERVDQLPFLINLGLNWKF